jgi:hypothetical protein
MLGIVPQSWMLNRSHYTHYLFVLQQHSAAAAYRVAYMLCLVNCIVSQTMSNQVPLRHPRPDGCCILATRPRTSPSHTFSMVQRPRPGQRATTPPPPPRPFPTFCISHNPSSPINKYKFPNASLVNGNCLRAHNASDVIV